MNAQGVAPGGIAPMANPPMPIAAYQNRIAAMFTASRQATNHQLNQMQGQVTTLRPELRNITATQNAVHANLRNQTVQHNNSQAQVQTLVMEIGTHHDNFRRIEEQNNALNDREASLQATVDKVVAIAFSVGIAVAGVAVMPVAPVAGQGMLGAVPAAVYAVKAPTSGDARFTFREFFKRLGIGLSTNSLISIISVPLVHVIGQHIAAKIIAQGWLSTLGTIIEKKANGDPIQMEKLLITFFASWEAPL